MGKLTYVDLFSGAGGFSKGFERAGFKNIFSVDFEKYCCETYRRNFPNHLLIEGDICSVKEDQVKEILGDKEVDVIIGGPPCQGFSIAGKIGRTFVDDPRNHLFKQFLRIVQVVRPRVFVMENVARLYTHNKGRTRQEIISGFENIGYNVKCKIVNAADMGAPQLRRRILFVGAKKGLPIFFPEKTVFEYRTVGEALGDLPALANGQTEESIPNHSAMKHTEQMLKKMSFVKDGGDRNDIPIELRPKSGDARKYIRYASDKPSVTVTGDMRKIFHYSQNRALTVRELARLQTYEDSFIFEGNVIAQQQQVGNSVPPLMAEAIAEAVKKMLLGERRNGNH